MSLLRGSVPIATANAAAATGSRPLDFRLPPTAFGKWEVMSAIRPADFSQVVKNGRMDRMMPPFGIAPAPGMPATLTDQQIRDVTAYAWTLHTTAKEVEAGKALYEANCASCHGADGKGAPGAASGKSLADWNTGAAATGQDWQKVIANGRGAMPAFAGKLDAGQQQAVQEYTRSLSMARMFRGPLPAGIRRHLRNRIERHDRPADDQPAGAADHLRRRVSRPRRGAASTDGSGLYRFDGLPTGTQYSYAATSDYPAGFPYGTEPKGFAMGATAMDLSLPRLRVHRGCQRRPHRPRALHRRGRRGAVADCRAATCSG